MLILFDHSTPSPLARELTMHSVVTARARGWEQLSNGLLLAAAEEAGFDVFLTPDQGIRYQQNLTDRNIAIVVLTGSSKWARVRLEISRIVATVDAAKSGSYAEVFVPFPPKKAWSAS